MSGHSKFANIKHKKEKNDAKKGKIFTVIGREIVVAVKEGGADPENNSRLRDVIAKAKANNMPNDTIERGIKKAAGDASADNYEYVTYEGYGPNGIAIIVDALTDNKNRTAGNVRSAFTKGNGSIGTKGCVSFMFDKKGQIIIDREECEMDGDDLMMMALDAGADGGEVGEHAAQPTGVYIESPGPAGLFLHALLGLLFGAHKEDVLALGGQIPHKVVGLLQLAHGFLQVDDVDAVALGEDIGGHLGVPAAGLVSEVDASFQQLLHRYYCHVTIPPGFFLRRTKNFRAAAATKAVPRGFL